MLSYPMRFLSLLSRFDQAACSAGSSRRRAICVTLTCGILLGTSTGCQRIFTMPNSMCPPQRLTGQNVAQSQLPPLQNVQHPSSQGFATVSPGVSPSVVDSYSKSIERQSQLPSVPPDNFQDYGPPIPPAFAQNGSGKAEDLGMSVSAIMTIVEKLHVAQDENAKLREKLAKTQAEKQQKEKLALKATEFAERLRSDNMQLQSDLKAWEDRIGQLEDLFAQRQTQQEDVLIDIEGQLEQLITEYESERSNTTTLNTSVP